MPYGVCSVDDGARSATAWSVSGGTGAPAEKTMRNPLRPGHFAPRDAVATTLARAAGEPNASVAQVLPCYRTLDKLERQLAAAG